MLQKYDEVISYKPGSQMYLADSLIRAFLTSSVNTYKENLKESTHSKPFHFPEKDKSMIKRDIEKI